MDCKQQYRDMMINSDSLIGLRQDDGYKESIELLGGSSTLNETESSETTLANSSHLGEIYFVKIGAFY